MSQSGHSRRELESLLVRFLEMVRLEGARQIQGGLGLALTAIRSTELDDSVAIAEAARIYGQLTGRPGGVSDFYVAGQNDVLRRELNAELKEIRERIWELLAVPPPPSTPKS